MQALLLRSHPSRPRQVKSPLVTPLVTEVCVQWSPADERKDNGGSDERACVATVAPCMGRSRQLARRAGRRASERDKTGGSERGGGGARRRHGWWMGRRSIQRPVNSAGDWELGRRHELEGAAKGMLAPRPAPRAVAGGCKCACVS